MRLDRGGRPQGSRGPPRDGRCGFEALAVHVKQRDRGPGELVEAEDVGQQLLRELDAAGPVEHDLRHQTARWGRTCSAHRSSCAVDGSRVWRIRYSTPMAILARGFSTISAGVPVRSTLSTDSKGLPAPLIAAEAPPRSVRARLRSR